MADTRPVARAESGDARSAGLAGTAAKIQAAYEGTLADAQPPADVCPVCGGAGWYIGHEDECYDSGDCQCGRAQVRCEQCEGFGEPE